MHRAAAKVLNLRNVGVGVGLTAATGAGVLWYALENSAQGYEHVVHAHPLPWSHSGHFDSLDYASVRRGYEVYKQVCAACHSLRFVRYRHFINVFMTEEEAKAEAAEALVKTIDDQGQPTERPGLINDYLPSPYPNKVAAAAANNGAAPPDLSSMANARHGGDEYFFALLTGYMEPPAGIKVDEGKAYNPYFAGGIIAMPQQLFDEGIEYKDGTVATQSQQAKDVVTFLRWCAENEHDKRKLYAMKALMFFPVLAFMLLYWKRYNWTSYKSQKLAWDSIKSRKPPTKSPENQ